MPDGPTQGMFRSGRYQTSSRPTSSKSSGQEQSGPEPHEHSPLRRNNGIYRNPRTVPNPPESPSVYGVSQPRRQSPLSNHVFMASELSEAESDFDSVNASAVTRRGFRVHNVTRVSAASQRLMVKQVHPVWEEPLANYDVAGSKYTTGSQMRLSDTTSDSYYSLATGGHGYSAHASTETFLHPSSSLSGYRKKLPIPPAGMSYQTQTERGRRFSELADPSEDEQYRTMIPKYDTAGVDQSSKDNRSNRDSAVLITTSKNLKPDSENRRHSAGSTFLYSVSSGSSEQVVEPVPGPDDRTGTNNPRRPYPLTSTPVQGDPREDSCISPSPPEVSPPTSPYPTLPPTPYTFASTVAGVPHSFTTNLAVSRFSRFSSVHSPSKYTTGGVSPSPHQYPPSTHTSSAETEPHYYESVAPSDKITPEGEDEDDHGCTTSVAAFTMARDRVLLYQLHYTYLTVPLAMFALATTGLTGSVIGIFASGTNHRPLAPSPSPKSLNISIGWEIGYIVLTGIALLAALFRLGHGYRSHYEYHVADLRYLKCMLAMDTIFAGLWVVIPTMILFVESSYPHSGLRANACRWRKGYDFDWHEKHPDFMDFPALCTLDTLGPYLGYVGALAHLISVGYGGWLWRQISLFRHDKGQKYCHTAPNGVNPFSEPTADDAWWWSRMMSRYQRIVGQVPSLRSHKVKPKVYPKPAFLTESEQMDEGIEVQPLSLDESSNFLRSSQIRSPSPPSSAPPQGLGKVKYLATKVVKNWY
ncbi:hypothetical protein IWQ61_001142 [Dispira simplex]|nr:hypothetical protein IWQ61_001142 [Dispira simplex]